jgi:hypothetical protein
VFLVSSATVWGWTVDATKWGFVGIYRVLITFVKKSCFFFWYVVKK